MSEQANTATAQVAHTSAWRRDFAQWFVEGARAAVFMAPRWQYLRAMPSIAVALILLGVLFDILFDRLYIDTAADFYWQAVADGWLYTGVIAWVCYLLRPGRSKQGETASANAAPAAAHLFCLLISQAQVLWLVFGLVIAVLLRAGWYSTEAIGLWGVWAVWLAPIIWLVAAQLCVLLRHRDRGPAVSALAVVAVLLATALWYAVPPADYWYATEAESSEVAPKRLHLTQDLMEQQPQLLAKRLQDMQPQRPGVVDMYAISFAPYASEDVFSRESAMVMEVMAKRFDAAGRTLQLVNHVDSLEQWPWATPLNLQRSIRHLASVMDREEDVLFLHLTSHGARDGKLAASFWPMSVPAVTPADLKAWLDEAGIRHRVISVSACYSGSWIAPLAGEGTLVMTAADAEHTSYGCGRQSELTYFGRAMYDEQLRTDTLSFEEAHAAARSVIKEREEQAGKSDGYSNPQISVGAEIRGRLMQLRERLAPAARP